MISGQFNATCLCSLSTRNDGNFKDGIVDCSEQYCPTGTDIDAIKKWLDNFCNSSKDLEVETEADVL